MELQCWLEKEPTDRVQKTYPMLVSGGCKGEKAREGRRPEVSGSQWDWNFKKGSSGVLSKDVREMRKQQM